MGPYAYAFDHHKAGLEQRPGITKEGPTPSVVACPDFLMRKVHSHTLLVSVCADFLMWWLTEPLLASTRDVSLSHPLTGHLPCHMHLICLLLLCRAPCNSCQWP